MLRSRVDVTSAFAIRGISKCYNLLSVSGFLLQVQSAYIPTRTYACRAKRTTCVGFCRVLTVIKFLVGFNPVQVWLGT
jgi:hypothetical protein